MKYLLDTHCFLFSLFNPESLGPVARKIIIDQTVEVHISAVSLLEISIKYSIGKLTLRNVEPRDLVETAKEMGLGFMDISYEDASTFYQLPKKEHKDPFDRLLIWQSIRNGLVLVSKDISFKSYSAAGLKTVW
jgi:PIN domain nuclease of toxin-antitoxin system